MPIFDYSPLAPEGRVHLTIAALAAIAAFWLPGYWPLAVWLPAVFVFQFFRDPKRHISTEPGAVVSPASGKIVSLGECENPYIDGARARKVSIFMNVFSVHSNLIPLGGVVRECHYHPGKFFNAALDKAAAENERNAIRISSTTGADIVVVQIAGLIARRIFSRVRAGDTVHTGQRYGFIRFGSRVDLYLPPDTPLDVRLGQWVQSGNTVLGRCLPPDTPQPS